MTPEYPHVQAAHVNALAEEGSREELIGWLQKQWNEICFLKSSISQARSKALEEAARVAEGLEWLADAPYEMQLTAAQDIAAAIRALKE